MSEVTRRVFIGLSVAGGVAAIGVTGWLATRPPEQTPELPQKRADAAPEATGPTEEAKAVMDAVTGAMSYLTLADGTLEAFAADHLRFLRKTRRYETNDLPQQFLMSTDFFQNGADEKRAVKYVAYFDPYMSPCYSPFSA